MGICNQHMLIFKTLGESQGLKINAYRGYYEKTPHDFTTVQVGDTEMLWDTAVNRWNEPFAGAKEYSSPSLDGTWDLEGS